jgi:hypothetical protein
MRPLDCIQIGELVFILGLDHRDHELVLQVQDRISGKLVRPELRGKDRVEISWDRVKDQFRQLHRRVA